MPLTSVRPPDGRGNKVPWNPEQKRMQAEVSVGLEAAKVPQAPVSEERAQETPAAASERTRTQVQRNMDDAQARPAAARAQGPHVQRDLPGEGKGRC